MRGLTSVATVSLFCAVLFADGLRICPSCGREDETGAAQCPTCGAALPPVEGAAQPAPPQEDAARGNVTDAMAEASRDVAEARKWRAESPERALALYENALALLYADVGGDFNEKAAAAVAKEIEALRTDARRRIPGVIARRLALQRGVREAELFFKAAGRVSCGRAWVPADWPAKLPPSRMAAVRQALPPPCKACDGLGFEVCHVCNGRGRQPCRQPGCQQGWIYEKSVNDLSPKTALKLRRKCPSCQGTTFAVCTGCNGSGAVVCRKCSGHGEAPQCAACRGSGLMECRDCRRKGAPDPCPTCHGTRQALCSKCGGDGRIPK